MPIVFQKYNVYNTDGRPGLTASEIENMPPADAAILIKYAIINQKTSVAEALQIISQLAPGKAGRILLRLLDTNIAGKIFGRLAQTNLAKTVSILMDIKEISAGNLPAVTGQNATKLIYGSNLSPETRERILQQIGLFDPSYVQAIKDHSPNGSKRIQNTPGPGTRVSYGPLPGGFVDQHAYKISGPNSKEQVLATWALGPCIAITLWDPQNKIGMVAHFDTRTNARRSLEVILQKMKAKGANISGLQAHIIGGWSNFSEGLLRDIRQGLSAKGLNAVEDTSLGSFGRVCGCSLNRITGEVIFSEENGAPQGTEQDALRNDRAIAAGGMTPVYEE